MLTPNMLVFTVFPTAQQHHPPPLPHLQYNSCFSTTVYSNIDFDVLQDDVAGCFEYYADLAEGLDAKQNTPVSLPMDTFKSYVRKEPIGVVGLITPW